PVMGLSDETAGSFTNALVVALRDMEAATDRFKAVYLPAAFLSRNMTTTIAALGSIAAASVAFEAKHMMGMPAGAAHLAGLLRCVVDREDLAGTTKGTPGLSIASPRSSLEQPVGILASFKLALEEWKGLLAPDHFDSMAQHVVRLLS